MRVYLRIIKYIKPYWAHLLGSILCIFFFTIFSSASLISIMPFLKTIFTPAQENPTILSEEAPEEKDISLLPGVLLDLKVRFRRGIDRLLGEDKGVALQRICLIIIAVIFFQNLFGYLQRYFMAYVEQGVIRDLRNDIYRHLNDMSLSYFNRTQTGVLISRITNDVSLINGGISASFVTLIKNPLLILAYLSLAFFFSWRLTLTALAVLPFSFFIIAKLGLKLRKESTASQEKMAGVTSILQETLSGVRIVKAFAMENFEIRRFANKTNEYFKTLLRITRVRNLASPLTEFLGTIVGVAILWFGGRQVLQGNMLAPEEFITFLFIIFSLMQPVKELGSVNNRIQEALAAGSRVFQVIDLKPEVKNPPNAVKIDRFEDSIKFINVSFSYDGCEKVLDGINLEVRKGQIIAIVGPSGGGKSTLVDLIPRFYDPTEGCILIDGRDLREIDLFSLRRLMGIVTQETFLFNDTVRNNIAYGLEDLPLERVIEAAKAANAHEFIQKLPQGYDTVIGERGVKLSGGQRQRLAIARAILKNPPILILDEATSALDTEAELLVQEAIERLMRNRTSFVIAHRLSTVQNADEIIVLNKGKIVQKGPHRELIQQEGLYRKLYQLQFKDY